VSDTGTISVWDARAGYGQVIARQRSNGRLGRRGSMASRVNGLRQCATHIGRVGTYGEIAARAGMVALPLSSTVASGRRRWRRSGAGRDDS